MHYLPDGHYTIVNQASNYVVGRKLAEEFSLAPKGIFTLGTAADVKYNLNFIWQLKQTHDGLYKLQVASDPVGNHEDGYHDTASVGEWRIEPVPQMGNDAYLIRLHDRSVGWVASAENAPQNKQIGIKGLIWQLMQPPRYLPTEVFIIKPAKPEDEQ